MLKSYLGFLIVCLAPTFVFGFSKNLPTTTFPQSFYPLFGNDHVVSLDPEGKSVKISLDQRSGAGFKSQNNYFHGYFSASIKLPNSVYSAGVVVAFYLSNSDVYPNSHDELDFELLGHNTNGNWMIQTNMYGNGSVSTGREEKYNFWFDPAERPHNYSILWTQDWIVFYVDHVPIRVTKRVDAMAGEFPSKPMSLFASIWDGSPWATDGGKHGIDYKYAPFDAMFSDFMLHGTDLDLNFKGLNMNEMAAMKHFRSKYMKYSYCSDRARYPTPLPECLTNPQEAPKA